MKTFRTDAIYGKMNPDTKEIEARTRKQLTEVAELFIRDCISKDIEICSAEGFFYGIVHEQLTMARAKVISDLKNKKFKVGDRVYFIDHYADEETDRIIEATITRKMGTVITMEGKNGRYKGAIVDREKDDLFMTADLALAELNGDNKDNKDNKPINMDEKGVVW